MVFTSKQVSLNTKIFKEMKYDMLSETFHQWSSSKGQTYGLNFASKDGAQTFHNTVVDVIQKMSSSKFLSTLFYECFI